MGYFPFFVELSGKEGLIIGGGVVALRKIRKLLPYGPHLTVVAPVIQREIEEIQGLTLLRRPFGFDLLSGKYFVIAATDDREKNHEISLLCQEQKILVNVVDDKEACTFIFPALVKKGKLSVGISTEGASPSAAIHVKEQINRWIPDNFDEILEFLESKRTVVKELFPEERQRSACLARMFKRCMETGQVMSEEELAALLKDKGQADPASPL